MSKIIRKEEIKQAVIHSLKKFGVIKASLFGSFVRGEQNEKSDIDMLVEFGDRENKTLLDLIGLELELEELLNQKVDVITYQSLNPLLKDYILGEQEVFYEEKS